MAPGPGIWARKLMLDLETSRACASTEAHRAILSYSPLVQRPSHVGPALRLYDARTRPRSASEACLPCWDQLMATGDLNANIDRVRQQLTRLRCPLEIDITG